MTNVDRLRALIQDHEQHLADLTGDEEMLHDALRQIRMDLANTMDEFVATTSRPASEFYRWRRKAKWAEHHKLKEIDRKRTAIISTKQHLSNAYMMLYAEESRYAGEDEGRLLNALYHLTMEILRGTQYQLDEHQLGLVAAVRLKAEGSAAHEGAV